MPFTPPADGNIRDHASREGLLETACIIVTKDRNTTHGHPEQSFAVIADYWRTHLKARFGIDIELLPEDVTIMMTQLKLARLTNNIQSEDNWVDGIGYLACGGELALRRSEP